MENSPLSPNNLLRDLYQFVPDFDRVAALYPERVHTSGLKAEESQDQGEYEPSAWVQYEFVKPDRGSTFEVYVACYEAGLQVPAVRQYRSAMSEWSLESDEQVAEIVRSNIDGSRTSFSVFAHEVRAVTGGAMSGASVLLIQANVVACVTFGSRSAEEPIPAEALSLCCQSFSSSRLLGTRP